uniref:Uncharacterized protein n=1 Tax=Glossina palpalis gambiensis TaxID=67801 RepID=A0A1B0B5U8_9MUSC
MDVRAVKLCMGRSLLIATPKLLLVVLVVGLCVVVTLLSLQAYKWLQELLPTNHDNPLHKCKPALRHHLVKLAPVLLKCYTVVERVDNAVAVVVADVFFAAAGVVDSLDPYTNQYHRHKQNNNYHKDFVQAIELQMTVVEMMVIVAVAAFVDFVNIVWMIVNVVDIVFVVVVMIWMLNVEFKHTLPGSIPLTVGFKGAKSLAPRDDMNSDKLNCNLNGSLTVVLRGRNVLVNKFVNG